MFLSKWSKTVQIVKTVKTVKILDLKKYHPLTDNLKARDASASKKTKMALWTSILSYCAPPPDICQINLGQIFASYNISHSLLQQIFVLQRFSVVVTTNIWFSHCYNLFALLQGLCVVTILLQRIHVVTISIRHIACNCYNHSDKPCNNGIFWLLQAFQTPVSWRVCWCPWFEKYFLIGWCWHCQLDEVWYQRWCRLIRSPNIWV